MEEEASITKEELDALLGKMEKEEAISPLEEKQLEGIYAGTMLSATKILSQVLNKQVKIENPEVKSSTPDELKSELPKNAIVVETEYTNGLRGMAYLVFLKEHGATMANLATGGDGTKPPEELTEVYLGALGDAIGKMIEMANASLSAKIGRQITSNPPKIKVIDFEKEKTELDILKEAQVVRIKYNINVGDLFEGNLIQLIPYEIAKPLIEGIEEKGPPPIIPSGPVQFAEVSPPVAEMPANMQLLMDVPVEISVELGRTNKALSELLKIGEGYIIELDKIAGEPVDVLVNGRPIAKASVVVVDENFGVRITSILTQKEREALLFQ